MCLSIIIPTLNEERYLEACIQTARGNTRSPVEIIVVDAGSQDATAEIAQQLADVLLYRPELKGLKYASLNAGAEAASGNLFLFLDADTHLPPNYEAAIINSINQGNVGGAFKLEFDVSGNLLKTIAFFNEIRYRWSHHFFGDQALFCTKGVFFEAGGFPEKQLMESANFCKALKKLGSLSLIDTPVITSSRRFQKGGVLKVFFQDLKIYLMDLFNIPNQRKAQEYWRFNQLRK